MAKGRSFSRVRTPSLVRDYLSGETFPGTPEEDGTPGAQEAIAPERGDYLASIHRHLKRRIREMDPHYHWPRYHSFVALMRNLGKLGLVEHTGEVEPSDILVLQGDPDGGGASPGDLRLDPARGFQERWYWRLTPGSQGDPAWDNPMASIRAIYGIELVARPRVRLSTPVGEEAPARLQRRPTGPRRRPAAPVEEPKPVSGELLELLRELEVRRQGLLSQAQLAAQSGEELVTFQSFQQAAADFIEELRPYYQRFPLRDLLLDLDTLTGCTEAFARAEARPQRIAALAACRRGAALAATDLTTPLPVPDMLGEPAEEEEAGPTPEVIDELEQRWQAVVDRITAWSRPNSTNAGNLLDRFVQEIMDAHPDLREDDLNSAIESVREKLEEYVELDRKDYDDAESYSEARAEAWQEFLDSFGEVDFSELGQV